MGVQWRSPLFSFWSHHLSMVHAQNPGRWPPTVWQGTRDISSHLLRSQAGTGSSWLLRKLSPGASLRLSARVAPSAGSRTLVWALQDSLGLGTCRPLRCFGGSSEPPCPSLLVPLQLENAVFHLRTWREEPWVLCCDREAATWLERGELFRDEAASRLHSMPRGQRQTWGALQTRGVPGRTTATPGGPQAAQ